MAETRTYRRIPGWSVKRLMGQRLWLGSDHLLLITSQFLTERYKRFYFPDIQAVTITRTSTGMIVNVVAGIAAGLFAVWAVVAYTILGWDWIPAIILGGISTFFLLLLALNAVLGPTCNCYLYTAVHCEEIYCLGRLSRARRVVRQLRGIIEPVQGSTLTDVQVDELVRVQGDLTSPGTVAAVQPLETRPGQQPLRRENGAVHAGLFAVLLVDATVNAIALIQPRFVPMPVGLISLVAVVGLTVAALIRQNWSTLPGQLRNVTWATFVYVCLIVVFVYIFMVIGQFAWEMGSEDTPPDLLAMQTGLGQIKNVISIAFDILLSAFGFRLLREYRNRERAVDAVSSNSPTAAPEQE